ncbi:MAG: serine hydrolase [Methylobacteriaceae bacterium]|nr:serine hydrolase [Methylobacteriaceae bacterium]MBV9220608.1 serine hydrolase [Methylobacteriaceae bacterium]MBV9246415.1 serine hydrolase [Methylobacteriaceae bacterium]MBV9633012.1 serine hydrolase [Methylobacteriaceae bacterium]MBV9704963.1 serine hydrolase [Methylobacteriaceae bacterium]
MSVLQRRWRLSTVAALLLLGGTTAGSATPSLVVDVDTGNVLHQEDATASWFPASLTKLMTAYVALRAVKDGRITLDTPLVVSARAIRVAPSRMGFRPGTQVTLDNALKMLMVKSANDIAITVAEGVSGSVEAFAAEMNADANRLGMRESYFDNPNGLPDPRQVTSARDMATVARALYKEFPEEHDLFGIGALQLGKQIILTHNGLLGRYPGADGMKTGFTCAAGFNVVASATRGSRRLIAVVLGASTVRERNYKAAQLFEAAFAGSDTSSGQLDSLPSRGVTAAPDIRGDVCTRHPKNESMGEEADEVAPTMLDPAQLQLLNRRPERAMAMDASRPATTVMALLSTQPHFDPVPVFIGPAPGSTAAVASARPAGATPVSAKLPPTPDPTVAYAPEKPKVLDGNDAAAAAASAAGPVALSGATTLAKSAAKLRPRPKRAQAKPAKVAQLKWTKPRPHAKRPAAATQ